MRCACGEKLVAKACRHIDAASQPRLGEKLLRGESRCKCGELLKVEREFTAHYPGQGWVAIVRARCVGCGEAKSFSFPIQHVSDELGKEAAKVPFKIKV